MPIRDLFSKRQKELRGELSDVYSYDEVPETLRVQVVHLWKDTIGQKGQYGYDKEVRNRYKFLVDTLCREYGVFRLTHSRSRDIDYFSEFINGFLSEADVERVLDYVELSFRLIDRVLRDNYKIGNRNASEAADDSIAELNARFREHAVGYEYSDGIIIRIDSKLVHTEVVKPALKLLNRQDYAGAQEEYLKAFEHFRHGNAKEAFNECLKAFESTMKAICDKKEWQYSNNATAKKLIQICMDNELIPAFWQQQYASLASLLESSVPTGRNKLSGHGQGTERIDVPTHLVAYMLHMTASAIVFLIEAESNQ